MATVRFFLDSVDAFLRDLGVSESRIREGEIRFLTMGGRDVARRAQEIASGLGSVAAKAGEDISFAGVNPGSGTPYGTVVYGGKAYSRGAEYGSYHYKQFQPWRGKGDTAGYFLWPAVREYRDRDMIAQWIKEVWPAIEHTFNE